MSKVVAFTGKSNSGKTTLIEKLINVLSQNYHVSVIKHDPKNKAEFDKEGKDSYRFFNNGANIAVISPLKTVIMLKYYSDIKTLCELFTDSDYIFIEGLKELQFPRICVARGEIDKEYINYSDAFALDQSVKNTTVIPKKACILDLNNLEEIICWIDENAQNFTKGTNKLGG